MTTIALIFLLTFTGCAPLYYYQPPAPPLTIQEQQALDAKQRALDLIDSNVIRSQARPKP